MSWDYEIGGVPHNSMDVDSSGSYLFIAVLNTSSQPEILKMATSLDVDATTPFSPGAGTESNVVCGDLNTEFVWAVGDFGSQAAVLFDGYNNIYWYSDTISDAWYKPARPVMLGPMDDFMLMTTTPGDTTLWESYWVAAAGPYWIEVNDGLPYQVNAIDRLGYDPEQMLIGSYWYGGGGYMSYSPSGGEEFETILDSLAAAVTAIIFG